MNDSDLKQRLADLRRDIVAWAKSHDVWYDASFTDWFSHFDTEPEPFPCVQVLAYDGTFYEVMNGQSDLEEELTRLIHDAGFHLEHWDNVTSVIYSNDDRYDDLYRDYFEWQWVCRLVRDDYGDLYEELFDYFVNNPAKLKELHHRDFEKLLDAVFRNNGYDASLGPGSGDGGVDLKLYHKDAIGDVVTLVQAKRYGDNNPIKLEAVSALSGVVEDQNANRGLFVTTSRFLPSAREFAERQSHRLELATSTDVARWCQTASSRIVRDKSTLVDRSLLHELIASQRSMKVPDRIVQGTWGYNCTNVTFCLVLKETKNAALLMKIPKSIVSGDGQIGACIPDLNATSTDQCRQRNVFRAKKSKSTFSEKLGYHGDHTLYTAWDGAPMHFNAAD